MHYVKYAQNTPTAAQGKGETQEEREERCSHGHSAFSFPGLVSSLPSSCTLSYTLIKSKVHLLVTPGGGDGALTFPDRLAVVVPVPVPVPVGVILVMFPSTYLLLFKAKVTKAGKGRERQGKAGLKKWKKKDWYHAHVMRTIKKNEQGVVRKYTK